MVRTVSVTRQARLAMFGSAPPPCGAVPHSPGRARAFVVAPAAGAGGAGGLRVYVQSREEFERWVREQQQLPQTLESAGKRVFESTACVNCHTISGTPAQGRFGPNLTHLMSRDTIAAGAANNTPDMLSLWIRNPDAIKPGSIKPAKTGRVFTLRLPYI